MFGAGRSGRTIRHLQHTHTLVSAGDAIEENTHERALARAQNIKQNTKYTEATTNQRAGEDKKEKLIHGGGEDMGRYQATGPKNVPESDRSCTGFGKADKLTHRSTLSGKSRASRCATIPPKLSPTMLAPPFIPACWQDPVPHATPPREYPGTSCVRSHGPNKGSKWRRKIDR